MGLDTCRCWLAGLEKLVSDIIPRSSRSLKLVSSCGSDKRGADWHHGCVCNQRASTPECGCLGWTSVGRWQGGWKDSRKVPHAALMHDGSAGRSRGKDQPGEGTEIQGRGFQGPFDAVMEAKSSLQWAIR